MPYKRDDVVWLTRWRTTAGLVRPVTTSGTVAAAGAIRVHVKFGAYELRYTWREAEAMLSPTRAASILKAIRDLTGHRTSLLKQAEEAGRALTILTQQYLDDEDCDPAALDGIGSD